MAYMAQLDENNVVTRVLSVSDANCPDPAPANEAQGAAFLEGLGLGGNWKQTSYNNNFRRAFAQQGFVYEPSADVFYNPVGPFPSWVLDENYNWQPPTPMPDDVEGSYWVWNEETLSWDSVACPTPEEGE